MRVVASATLVSLGLMRGIRAKPSVQLLFKNDPSILSSESDMSIFFNSKVADQARSLKLIPEQNQSIVQDSEVIRNSSLNSDIYGLSSIELDYCGTAVIGVMLLWHQYERSSDLMHDYNFVPERINFGLECPEPTVRRFWQAPLRGTEWVDRSATFDEIVHYDPSKGGQADQMLAAEVSVKPYPFPEQVFATNVPRDLPARLKLTDVDMLSQNEISFSWKFDYDGTDVENKEESHDDVAKPVRFVLSAMSSTGIVYQHMSQQSIRSDQYTDSLPIKLPDIIDQWIDTIHSFCVIAYRDDAEYPMVLGKDVDIVDLACMEGNHFKDRIYVLKPQIRCSASGPDTCPRRSLCAEFNEKTDQIYPQGPLCLDPWESYEPCFLNSDCLIGVCNRNLYCENRVVPEFSSFIYGYVFMSMMIASSCLVVALIARLMGQKPRNTECPNYHRNRHNRAANANVVSMGAMDDDQFDPRTKIVVNVTPPSVHELPRPQKYPPSPLTPTLSSEGYVYAPATPTDTATLELEKSIPEADHNIIYQQASIVSFEHGPQLEKFSDQNQRPHDLKSIKTLEFPSGLPH